MRRPSIQNDLAAYSSSRFYPYYLFAATTRIQIDPGLFRSCSRISQLYLYSHLSPCAIFYANNAIIVNGAKSSILDGTVRRGLVCHYHCFPAYRKLIIHDCWDNHCSVSPSTTGSNH